MKKTKTMAATAKKKTENKKKKTTQISTTFLPNHRGKNNGNVFGCDKLNHLLLNILCIKIKCKTSPVCKTFEEEGISNYDVFSRVDINTL